MDDKSVLYQISLEKKMCSHIWSINLIKRKKKELITHNHDGFVCIVYFGHVYIVSWNVLCLWECDFLGFVTNRVQIVWSRKLESYFRISRSAQKRLSMSHHSNTCSIELCETGSKPASMQNRCDFFSWGLFFVVQSIRQYL